MNHPHHPDELAHRADEQENEAASVFVYRSIDRDLVTLTAACLAHGCVPVQAVARANEALTLLRKVPR